MTAKFVFPPGDKWIETTDAPVDMTTQSNTLENAQKSITSFFEYDKQTFNQTHLQVTITTEEVDNKDMRFSIMVTFYQATELIANVPLHTHLSLENKNPNNSAEIVGWFKYKAPASNQEFTIRLEPCQINS